MNKKALLPMEEMVKLIAFLAAAAMVLFLSIAAFRTTTVLAESGICTASLFAQSETKIMGGDSPIGKNLCFTRYIRIKPEGVFHYDYESKAYVKDVLYPDLNDKEKQADYIQKVAADEMYNCWRSIGQGGLDPYGKYDGESRCRICSQIDFDKELIDPTQTYPFHDYLQKNYIKSEKGKPTYWDYLTGGAKGDMEIELKPEPMTVVLQSVKPDSRWKIGGETVAVGTLVGSCASLPYIAPYLGWALGKAPLPVVGIAGKALRLGSLASKPGRKLFAAFCSGKTRAEWSSKGGLIFGSAGVYVDANGDEKPIIIVSQLVPSKDVGEQCEKLG